MKAPLVEVETVLLSRVVAIDTHLHLRRAGDGGLEGMALWAGTIDGSCCHVTEAIIPKQYGTQEEHGLLVQVPGDELHRINVHLYRKGLRLIGQIHSHPSYAYHSEVDDRYAIATELGGFSLVVPDFARGPFAIDHFATYRLMEGFWWWNRRPRWRKLPPDRAAQIIVMED